MPLFVVHEHWATAHHFDGGVLKSWAVPKGPSLEAGIRRLAVAVDDHPIDYGSFEGTIPEGEYGSGKVVIWDKGAYSHIERSLHKIHVDLRGNKLKGEYELIYFKEERGRAQWLLFKKAKESKKMRG